MQCSSSQPTIKPWQCGDPHLYEVPKNGDPWDNCHDLVKRYDNEMCNAWRDEAGLFSAAVTAFTIESYKWLQLDSSDVSVQLLQQISVQLDPMPTSAAVRINIFWFLSLTLGLSTVLIGILCMQWLREYRREASLPHKDAVALRQMRYEGLLAWKVPVILSALPLMLQLALLFFFVGLLDLLWLLHHLVAIIITAVVGLVFVFLVCTTILPSLQYICVADEHLRVPQCAFKSPQSWAFHRLMNATITKLPAAIKSIYPRFFRYWRCMSDTDWVAFDLRWRKLRDIVPVTE
ncbi:hypothetical protein BDQ12DRAFT_608446 [Crucibulum laeve]|uniref:DUF6535 domain-containing protein n=1 Tax=Crucibulum laeve TaxID=68775 RepID=A0A5C3LX38_9AGAR|nr:hypothetical protein BDQ12DRAFT_608446 [Crucibulum laeve]